MTILVDMDDTIEMLLAAWIREANRRYSRNVQYDDVKEWDVSKSYPGLTRKQIYDIVLENEFWQTVEPMPGAAEALEHMMRAGHELFIVTATDYKAVPAKMGDLLFRYFPFLSWDQVIITSKKQLIKGDVLIDDGPHNLQGGEFQKILMDAPHNREFDAEANGMIRVHSWDEIINVLDRMTKCE